LVAYVTPVNYLKVTNFVARAKKVVLVGYLKLKRATDYMTWRIRSSLSIGMWISENLFFLLR